MQSGAERIRESNRLVGMEPRAPPGDQLLKVLFRPLADELTEPRLAGTARAVLNTTEAVARPDLGRAVREAAIAIRQRS